MMGYFKPLRRKFGVITLLMACAVATEWIRSTVICDYMSWRFEGGSSYHVESVYGMIWCARRTPATRNKPFEYGRNSASMINEYLQENGNPSPFNPWKHHSNIEWRADWIGFHFGASTSPMNRTGIIRRTEFWIIPYWSIVIPLTIISAWLLLSKPRTKLAPSITPASENA